MKLLLLIFLPLSCFSFTKDYGKADIVLTDTVLTGSFKAPKLLDTRNPDLNEDGIYVVYANPGYSFGGGFAHLQLTYNTAGKKVLYTQGTVLEKKKGIWSRYFDGFGFKTAGNIICRNVTFTDFSYLFSPFGMDETEKIEFVNCKFINVSRVISSCTYGAYSDSTWCNSLFVYPTNGALRFKNITFTGCTFDNIHTNIIWGIPPTSHVEFTNNVVRNCPTAIAFVDTYMKKYRDSGSDEGYWTDKVTELISGNRFENIIQTNNWTVSLIRTCGFSNVVRNEFINVSPQIVLFYGGNSTFENNVVDKINTNKEVVSAVVLVKNVGSPIHVIKGNKINAPYSVLVGVEGTASFVISENYGSVQTVFNKQDNLPGTRQFVRINDNSMKAANILTIAARDSTLQFGYVELIGNNFTGVIAERYGKMKILNYQKL